MSYIGQGLGQGKAERFIFTASGSETSVTLDDAGRGIVYTPGQVDVYLNGVKLVNGTDFTATSGSSITGLSALSASDVVEIVALDAFSPADTVSAASGGTFAGNTTFTANLTSTGTTALQNLSTTNSALNISSSASDGSATIDASGNLLVGKTSSGFSNVGFEFNAPNNTTNLTRDGGAPLWMNRKTSDGDIAVFSKDGTTVGSIGATFGDLYIGTGDVGLQMVDGSDCIAPLNANTPAVRDAAIDLGLSSGRFKNLYLSGGVYLGGTGSANYLDDYEEGTWTATMSSGSVTADRTTYTKVGRLVTVQARLLDITDYTTAAAVLVQGLPFTVSSSGGSHIGSVMYRYINVGRNTIIAQTSTSATTFAFVGVSADNSLNWSTLQYSDATAPWDIFVSLTYETDS